LVAIAWSGSGCVSASTCPQWRIHQTPHKAHRNRTDRRFGPTGPDHRCPGLRTAPCCPSRRIGELNVPWPSAAQLSNATFDEETGPLTLLIRCRERRVASSRYSGMTIGQLSAHNTVQTRRPRRGRSRNRSPKTTSYHKPQNSVPDHVTARKTPGSKTAHGLVRDCNSKVTSGGG